VENASVGNNEKYVTFSWKGITCRENYLFVTVVTLTLTSKFGGWYSPQQKLKKVLPSFGMELSLNQ
jgi:hypothetical protein